MKINLKPLRENYLFIALCVILCVPLVFSTVSHSFVSTVENRVLAAPPVLKFDVESLQKFPSVYEAYFNDNFGLRNQLIYWFHKGLVSWLDSSPQVNIIMGKSGWLYYTNENIADRFYGINLYTPEQLNKITKLLIVQRDWLAARHIDFYIFIPPDKETIYPEYLYDPLAARQPETRMSQLLRYLAANTDLTIIDIRQPLMQAKQNNLTYFKTDSHWNSYGAFIAYQQLLPVICSNHPCGTPKKLSDYKVSTHATTGRDLATIMAVPELSDTDVILTPQFPSLAKWQKLTNTPLPILQSTVNDPALPTILVFRDSFGDALIPYLGEHFSKATYEQKGFAPEDIQPAYPDIVLLEVVERYFTQ